jgi:hypothetical protein
VLGQLIYGDKGVLCGGGIGKVVEPFLNDIGAGRRTDINVVVVKDVNRDGPRRNRICPNSSLRSMRQLFHNVVP